MKRIHYILSIPALALLVAACDKFSGSPDGPVGPAGDEIVVSANLPVAWSTPGTKAEIASDANLQTAGFGLFAYYTGNNNYSDISSARGVIFNDRQVTYTNPKWSYGSFNEYWPTKDGEKVSFFAYAPYGDWTPATTGSAPTIEYTPMATVSAANIAAQKDLLWGTQSGGGPYRNVTHASTNGVVNMYFRHAISKMRFFVAGGATASIEEPGNPEYSNMEAWQTTEYNGNNENSSTERTQRRAGRRNYNNVTSKYYVKSVSVSDLYSSGSLSLNNADAYVPAWSGWTGNVTYNLASVLNPSISNTNNNGVGQDLTAVMNDESYYIYVIPGAKASFSLTYFARETRTPKYHQVYEYRKQIRTGTGNNWSNATTVDTWYEDYGTDNNNGQATTANGEDVTVSATMPSPILPSRKYDVNLYLGGSKFELFLVPRNWELSEQEKDYTDDENPRLQLLTYDSDYIDYARGGDVYINNRLGKFYFRLGTGKYKFWQASLISSEGSEVFGFCDSEGNFLLDDQGNKQTLIRGPIDGSMCNLYMRALDPSSTTGGKAKLRIYLFDSDDVPTIALNLVGLAGVTEWTIIQNAN